MEILTLILLTLSVIGICVFVKCMTNLNKHIDELEKKIDTLQYQTDDVLCDINIVNENVLNNYGLLSRIENENHQKEVSNENIPHNNKTGKATV